MHMKLIIFAYSLSVSFLNVDAMEMNAIKVEGLPNYQTIRETLKKSHKFIGVDGLGNNTPNNYNISTRNIVSDVLKHVANNKTNEKNELNTIFRVNFNFDDFNEKHNNFNMFSTRVMWTMFYNQAFGKVDEVNQFFEKEIPNIKGNSQDNVLFNRVTYQNKDGQSKVCYMPKLAAISNLKKHYYDSKSCAICLDNIGNKVPIEPIWNEEHFNGDQSSHIHHNNSPMHYKCVEEWNMKNKECPICKAPCTKISS